jgi:hypothetical protein
VTGTNGCASIRLALGVYVLGAADPAERAVVRMHLTWCRACREDLAGLAGLPGLLRRLPADQAETLLAGETEGAGPADPLPERALPQLLGRIARARRARRWRAAGTLAAAVVIAVGGGIAVQHAHGASRPTPSRPVAWTTVSARNDVTLAGATVRYAAMGWGTEVEVRVSGIAAGTACTLRVTGPGRQASIAGDWTIVARKPGVWYPAATSLAASAVRGFSLTAGGRTLVTVPVSASALPGGGPRA